MVRIVKDLIRPKYNGKNLRNLMAKTFGPARISDTLTDVVIPTFDIKLLQPVVFSTSEVIFITIQMKLHLQIIYMSNEFINSSSVALKYTIEIW